MHGLNTPTIRFRDLPNKLVTGQQHLHTSHNSFPISIQRIPLEKALDSLQRRTVQLTQMLAQKRKRQNLVRSVVHSSTPAQKHTNPEFMPNVPPFFPCQNTKDSSCVKPSQSQTTVSFIRQEGSYRFHKGMGWILGTPFQRVDQQAGEQDPKSIPETWTRRQHDLGSPQGPQYAPRPHYVRGRATKTGIKGQRDHVRCAPQEIVRETTGCLGVLQHS